MHHSFTWNPNVPQKRLYLRLPRKKNKETYPYSPPLSVTYSSPLDNRAEGLYLRFRTRWLHHPGNDEEGTHLAVLGSHIEHDPREAVRDCFFGHLTDDDTHHCDVA